MRVLSVIGGLFVTVVVVVAIGVLGWVGNWYDLTINSYFAPSQEQVRRDVFEQSKAYNQGMIQDLQGMQFDYAQADDAHKPALADIILHRTADFDVSKLPPDLRSFVEKLRLDRTNG
jgi:hypothetical protein